MKLKHLLTVEQLSLEQIEMILHRAETFIQPDGRIYSEYPFLQGKTVANLFFEPSTRTRSTFELAAKKLGADVINLDIENSSTKKGETVKDTFLTMLAMQCDAIVIRHPEEGIAEYVASLSDQVSVLNAGDGAHAHPTQALLDLLTIRRHKGDFANLSVAIVGDILHSRVARSQIAALKAVGVKDIRIVAPEALLPKDPESFGVKIYQTLNEGLSGVDVVITLRLQHERMKADDVPSFLKGGDDLPPFLKGGDDLPPFLKGGQGGFAYFNQFGIKTETLKLAKPDAIVMHPGPINREVEISSEVADGAQSLILKQVTYGLAVRMAVLTLLLD